jgi:hypothetical protein
MRFYDLFTMQVLYPSLGWKRELKLDDSRSGEKMEEAGDLLVKHPPSAFEMVEKKCHHLELIFCHFCELHETIRKLNIEMTQMSDCYRVHKSDFQLLQLTCRTIGRTRRFSAS